LSGGGLIFFIKLIRAAICSLQQQPQPQPDRGTTQSAQRPIYNLYGAFSWDPVWVLYLCFLTYNGVGAGSPSGGLYEVRMAAPDYRYIPLVIASMFVRNRICEPKGSHWQGFGCVKAINQKAPQRLIRLFHADFAPRAPTAKTQLESPDTVFP
jgi:hypothetical protein